MTAPDTGRSVRSHGPVASPTSLVPRLPREAWVVLGGDALSALGSGLTLPFLLIYFHQVRGIDLLVAGLAVAAVPFASLVGNPLGGWLADRGGGPRRRPDRPAGGRRRGGVGHPGPGALARLPGGGHGGPGDGGDLARPGRPPRKPRHPGAALERVLGPPRHPERRPGRGGPGRRRRGRRRLRRRPGRLRPRPRRACPPPCRPLSTTWPPRHCGAATTASPRWRSRRGSSPARSSPASPSTPVPAPPSSPGSSAPAASPPSAPSASSGTCRPRRTWSASERDEGAE